MHYQLIQKRASIPGGTSISAKAVTDLASHPKLTVEANERGEREWRTQESKNS